MDLETEIKKSIKNGEPLEMIINSLKIYMDEFGYGEDDGINFISDVGETYAEILGIDVENNY